MCGLPSMTAHRLVSSRRLTSLLRLDVSSLCPADHIKSKKRNDLIDVWAGIGWSSACVR